MQPERPAWFAAYAEAEAKRKDDMRHARGLNPEQPLCHETRLADEDSEVTCRSCLSKMQRYADALDRSSSGE